MFVVTSLSLLLLVYVAYAEGKRIYEQFQIEKLVAQGTIVQYSMENYLRAGLALRDYVGFNAMVEPMVGIDEIDGVGVYDDTGRQLFLVTDEKIPGKTPEPSALVKRWGDEPSVDQSGATYYQIVLPLRSRFGTVGALVLYVPIAVIAQRLDESFRPLLYAAAGLSTLFAVMVALAGGHLARSRTPWLQLGYALTFLCMAGFVLLTLLSLYSDGAQSKAKASAFTLSERLKDIPEFNLRFRDFSGLDKVFSDYKQANPDISHAALILDGRIEASVDPSKIGRTWHADKSNFEYLVNIGKPNSARKV